MYGTTRPWGYNISNNARTGGSCGGHSAAGLQLPTPLSAPHHTRVCHLARVTGRTGECVMGCEEGGSVPGLV